MIVQGRVRIVPLYPDGVAEVFTHMRASDRAEVLAVSQPTADLTQMGRDAASRSRWGAVALVDGKPAAAFGAIEAWPGAAAVWLIATDEWASCWRAVARWMRAHIPAIMRDGNLGTAFVFAIEGREEVGRLLRGVGFEHRGAVPRFGRGGETFALWSRTGEA